MSSPMLRRPSYPSMPQCLCGWSSGSSGRQRGSRDQRTPAKQRTPVRYSRRRGGRDQHTPDRQRTPARQHTPARSTEWRRRSVHPRSTVHLSPAAHPSPVNGGDVDAAMRVRRVTAKGSATAGGTLLQWKSCRKHNPKTQSSPGFCHG